MKIKEKIRSKWDDVDGRRYPFLERTEEVLKKVAKFARDYFLVIGMIVVLIIGVQLSKAGLQLAKIPTEYVCLVIIFFLIGLQLQTDEVYSGIKSYRAIIWSLFSILLLTPMLGMQITKTIHFATLSDENMTTSRSVVHANVSAIGPTEFAIGLQVFLASPATVSVGIVLIVLAGGNFALSLLICMVTNFACVLTVGPMLAWMAGISSAVHMKELSYLVAIFILTVFVPSLTGKILRISQTVEGVVDRHRTCLRFLIQVVLIFLTWPKVSEAKEHNAYTAVVAMNLLAIIGYTTILHIMFLLINFIAAYVMGLDLKGKKTVVLLCSHKALAFALKSVTFLPKCAGSHGLMSISCIIAHLTMITVDSVLVCVWAPYEEMDVTDEVAGLDMYGKYDRLIEKHND